MFSCAKKLTKEYFTASAWKASKPDRRLCVACQQKCRGHWTCAQCCRKLPLLQFSRYSALRPGGGQDGRERQTELQLQAKGDDADAAGQEKGNPENTIAANVRWRTYRCPACNAEVQSTVVNGNVHSRGHCGRQFRVAAGVVRRSYLHACPTCNTTVETTKPDGRIQKQHKDSTGRLCKTYQWKSAGPVSDA